MTDLQIANMLADYHKECELAKTLTEKADVQLKHARLIREALRQPLVSGRSEQLKCDCGNTENVKLIPICPCCYNPHSGEW